MSCVSPRDANLAMWRLPSWMNVAFGRARTDAVLVGEQQGFDIHQRPTLLNFRHLASPTVGQRVAKGQRQCATVAEPSSRQKKRRVAQRKVVGIEREAGRFGQIASAIRELAGLHDAVAGKLQQADRRSCVAAVLREADIQRRRAPGRDRIRNHVRLRG